MGLVTAQGVHQVVVMGDERPCSSKILEGRINAFDRRIEKWKPDTPWDAANQRSLRVAKKYRTAAMKALMRQENKEKELALERERREIQVRRVWGEDHHTQEPTE